SAVAVKNDSLTPELDAPPLSAVAGPLRIPSGPMAKKSPAGPLEAALAEGLTAGAGGGSSSSSMSLLSGASPFIAPRAAAAAAPATAPATAPAAAATAASGSPFLPLGFSS